MSQHEFYHLVCPLCSKRMRVRPVSKEKKAKCPRDGCAHVHTIPAAPKTDDTEFDVEPVEAEVAVPPQEVASPDVAEAVDLQKPEPPAASKPARTPPASVPALESRTPKPPAPAALPIPKAALVAPARVAKKLPAPTPTETDRKDDRIARIVVAREDEFRGSVFAMTVYVNEDEAFSLVRGEVKKFPVVPGTHAIYAQLANGKESKNYQVRLKSGQRVVFKCGIQEGFPESTLNLEVAEQPFEGSVREAKRKLKPASAKPVPHNGATILVLGLLAFCAGCFGFMAIGYGIDSLQKMNAGSMEESESGRLMIKVGIFLGAVGLLLNIVVGLMQAGGAFK